MVKIFSWGKACLIIAPRALKKQYVRGIPILTTCQEKLYFQIIRQNPQVDMIQYLVL